MCRVPGMLFQPIVENSIVHGLSDKLNNGGDESTIAVEGRIEGENVLFTVRDNGKGMSAEEIQSVFQTYPQSTRNSVEIGVKNIHERIRYRFGDQYGLRIESRVGEYTMVTVVLPALRHGEK